MKFYSKEQFDAFVENKPKAKVHLISAPNGYARTTVEGYIYPSDGHTTVLIVPYETAYRPIMIPMTNIALIEFPLVEHEDTDNG